jgi:glycine cleavage system H lipoate-binding protein
MEAITLEMFATKGIEYLLVIGYLVLLVPMWLFLSRRTAVEAVAEATAKIRPAAATWFRLPDNAFFHPGHAWAMAEGDGVLRIGVDEFAQKLVGDPEALRLPETGTALRAGETGWELGIDDTSIAMLAPVAGEVVDVNAEAIDRPRLVAEDPYGEGWLMKVKVPRTETAVKNLLPSGSAAGWMSESVADLQRRMPDELGTVLQDGGEPVSGMARQIVGDDWPTLVAELLRTK